MEQKTYKYKLLIADDELLLTRTLKNVLTRYGYDIHICNRGAEVLSAVKLFQPDVILLDIFLGDMNGIELLKQLNEFNKSLSVIMITANSDVGMAVRAMKEGALDYVVKPFNTEQIDDVIKKALQTVQLRSAYKISPKENSASYISSIIAESDEMKNVLIISKKFASSTSTTVLIQGESGTGKELIARSIHNLSARSKGPFVSLNCGAIPRDLAESELFGYEKGAFTGATEKLKQGKFELAHKGTILLDEIGELNLEMQVKLLRVLEEKRFYRLGGTKEIDVDVRVVASSNRDLQQEIEMMNFREDLFYRLNVATIQIPPLRERKQDIMPMVAAFLREFSSKFQKEEFLLADDTKQFLENYYWKGNVRELRNAVERIVLLNQPCVILPEHFSFLRSHHSGNGYHFPTRQTPQQVSSMHLEILHPEKQHREVREIIISTLIKTGGNQLKASRLLGLTRAKLRYRIKQLHISLDSLKG
ncbi:MAG: sigma-54 dependent transcriptional regulator [Bacteroidota bacterium]